MTRLKDKVAVPELSAAAQTRVERRFVEAVRGGEGRTSGAAAFARGFATLAAGIAVAGVAIAIAINVKGALENRAVIVPEVSATTTEVTTGADAATVRLGDATVLVGANSELVLLRQASGEVSVALRRGTIDCEVEPRPNRPTFWVGADDVRVRVVGTLFSVSHDPQASELDRVEVAVTRGKVAVAANGSEVFVGAGSQWSARDGVTQAVASVEPTVPANDSIETEAETDKSSDDGEVKEPKRPRQTDKAPKTAAGSKDQKAKKPKLASPRRMSAPESDPELLAAMELDASDPRAAIAAYTKIATRSRGKRASFALYSRAYVEYVKLGDRRAALRTLDLFRRRFPKAREMQSALWLQIKALCGGEQAERCRAAAHSYVRRYPSGRFANDAQKIIDTL